MILRHVKGIILTSMDEKPEVKTAVLNFINALDDNLGDIEFESELMNEEVQEAIEALDKALCDIDEIDVPEERDEVISRTSATDEVDEPEES